jgi:ribosome biogenesis GTPase A
LFDTPGMLWPRIVVEQSGLHLAVSGAVGKNAYDEELVAMNWMDTLRQNYPQLLQARYKLGDLSGLGGEAVLQAIGRQRGALLAGGRINLQKASEIVITEFRTATLGRITLETPQAFEQWLAAVLELEAERQAKKLARSNKNKSAALED